MEACIDGATDDVDELVGDGADVVIAALDEVVGDGGGEVVVDELDTDSDGDGDGVDELDDALGGGEETAAVVTSSAGGCPPLFSRLAHDHAVLLAVVITKE
jgi:hypothetical protein